MDLGCTSSVSRVSRLSPTPTPPPDSRETVAWGWHPHPPPHLRTHLPPPAVEGCPPQTPHRAAGWGWCPGLAWRWKCSVKAPFHHYLDHQHKDNLHLDQHHHPLTCYKCPRTPGYHTPPRARCWWAPVGLANGQEVVLVYDAPHGGVLATLVVAVGFALGRVHPRVHCHAPGHSI